MSFHVGQLVVCADDAPRSYAHIAPPKGSRWGAPAVGLRRGAVYTIRDVGRWANVPHEQVRVSEIVRGSNSDGSEAGFHAARFRPVDNNRLAIFRKMLAPTPNKTVDA